MYISKPHPRFKIISKINYCIYINFIVNMEHVHHVSLNKNHLKTGYPANITQGKNSSFHFMSLRISNRRGTAGTYEFIQIILESVRGVFEVTCEFVVMLYYFTV